MTSGSILAFNVLCFIGLALLIAVFCTAWWSPKVPRASTWFTFIASCILTTIVNLLILGHQEGKDPNRINCIIQAISIYPVAVLDAHTAAALLLQVYLSMIFIRKSRTLSPLYILLLNIVPVLTPCGMLLYGVVIASQNPSLLQRDQSGMRCDAVTPQLFDFAEGASIVGVLMILVLEVLVVSNLFRYRSTYEELLTGSRMSPQVIIRVCSFNIFAILAAIVSLLHLGHNIYGRDILNLTAAIIPVAAGIIFGTQGDILTVCIFGRKPAAS